MLFSSLWRHSLIIAFVSSRFPTLSNKSGQKFKHLWNEASFQHEIKSIFHLFERAFIEANKNNFLLEYIFKFHCTNMFPWVLNKNRYIYFEWGNINLWRPQKKSKFLLCTQVDKKFVYRLNTGNFRLNNFLIQHSGGCFLQFYHATVKSVGVFVLWFRASTCFRFWSKTFTKRCTNNFYYDGTKQFLPWSNWLVTWFQFQNMFWKNINCFQVWWETYRKRCISKYVISRAKRHSFSALCGWSGAFNFRVWFGKRKNAV